MNNNSFYTQSYNSPYLFGQGYFQYNPNYFNNISNYTSSLLNKPNTYSSIPYELNILTNNPSVFYPNNSGISSNNTNNTSQTNWLGWGKLGFDAINAIGSIYGGLKQLGLAEDQLAFQKNAFNTNLANSIKSYNTALEDRARSRYAYLTGDASNADEYIEKNKL